MTDGDVEEMEVGCSVCNTKLEIVVYEDDTYEGGNYLGPLLPFGGEYWLCDGCYENREQSRMTDSGIPPSMGPTMGEWEGWLDEEITCEVDDPDLDDVVESAIDNLQLIKFAIMQDFLKEAHTLVELERERLERSLEEESENT